MGNLTVDLVLPLVERFNAPEKVLIIITLSLISIITVIGNILVFLAYHKNKQLQITTNYFILSLAVADVFIGIFSVNFYTIYLIYGYWPLGIYVCDFYLSMDYWSCQTSVFNLVAISIDRYLSIRFPVKYRQRRTKKFVLIVIALIWIVSFLIWVPWIISYQFIKGERTVGTEACYIQFLYESWYITILTAILAYYGPIILMAIIYVQIYYLLKKRKQKISSLSVVSRPSEVSASFGTGTSDTFQSTQADRNPAIVFNRQQNVRSISSADRQPTPLPKSNAEDSVMRERRNTKFSSVRLKRQSKLGEHEKAITLMVLIFLAFLITWLPYDLFAVIAPFCADCISMGWWDFGYLFCYVNSTLNPFCYALGNRKFRTTFKRILFPWKISSV